jgi:hypothetical protein
LQVNFRGYALAGGGRGIERVDLSVDGGKTWLEAVRLPREHFPGEDHDPQRPNWAWVLWELKYIKVCPPVDVIVKAVFHLSLQVSSLDCCYPLIHHLFRLHFSLLIILQKDWKDMEYMGCAISQLCICNRREIQEGQGDMMFVCVWLSV